MTAHARTLTPARLGPVDVARIGSAGLRTRPLRVVLSAIGIAIGIAAMISVVGIAASSQERLNRELAALGTNLLRATPGHTIFGDPAHLPTESVAMVGRIGPVTSVTATGAVTNALVYRTDKISPLENGSIAVLAAGTDLLHTVGATVVAGTWLNAATANYPTVVLGHDAAHRLGASRPGLDTQVWLGHQWFTVVGVLNPVPLAPELDSAALIGWPVAVSLLDFDGYPTTIYTRTRDNAVADVEAVLAATANPEHPDQVDVSRPSDALAAQTAVDTTLQALLIGLGGVALLVGGIGVANTMIISVLERRTEIGLRRSLGATRGNIRTQFLTESLALSLLGGGLGILIGIGATTAYAASQHWPAVVPAWATLGTLAVTIAVGGIAGIYPAWRAARLTPTEALASP